VVTGFNGFDFNRFRRAGMARERAGAWPRRFLFAGRYVPVKGLDVLMRAYAQYRSRVTGPWELHCCGSGTDAPLLREQPGVVDLGYMLPTRLPELFAEYGTFIMPSRLEPWGVAIAEAIATGMPVICTHVCGAAADVVRPYYNGVVVPPDDVEALSRALTWIHEHEDRLVSMGERGRALVHPFGAAAWAERMHEYITIAVARQER
jgi:glycosyltransferase involved in cell wall biosynthesis